MSLTSVWAAWLPAPALPRAGMTHVPAGHQQLRDSAQTVEPRRIA
jgi:hypothetical protein